MLFIRRLLRLFPGHSFQKIIMQLITSLKKTGHFTADNHLTENSNQGNLQWQHIKSLQHRNSYIQLLKPKIQINMQR